MTNRFWNAWNLTAQEELYVHALERALERILSLGDRVIAVYVGGSFVRRELHERSDIDTWTIVRTAADAERVSSLKDDTKPRISYSAFTLDELRSGIRSDRAGVKSSPKRFVADLGSKELVYGSLDASALPSFNTDEDLAGRIQGWAKVLDAYRAGSMAFSFVAKYLCWIAIARERAVGRGISKVSELLERYPDGVVARCVAWSREESCSDEKVAVREMNAWVGDLE